MGNPFNFVKMWMEFTDTPSVTKWFADNGLIIKDRYEKVQKTRKADILANYMTDIIIRDNFTPEIMGAIKTWLINRGFDRDYIDKDETQQRIQEVFNIMGFVAHPTTKQDKQKNWIESKPVLVFPQLSPLGEVIGVKMRKVNNKPEDETSKDSKSINIKGSKSGLLFHSLDYIKNCEDLIICEGEADYVCLRMIGYDNVIGNLGGVAASKGAIREFVKGKKNVIIAYDNDDAGKAASQKLMNYCNVRMKIPLWDNMESPSGEPYKDINDFIE